MSAQASRLTFRRKAGEVCYQKQIRDRYSDEDEPPVPHKNVSRARVRRVDRDVAEQIILKYEWLGTLPNGLTDYFGIFFGPFCAGVTCVGVGSGGANVQANKEWGVGTYELAYLARGACVHWAPENTNSKLVSWTCQLISQQTSARIIIAYADTDAGEIGTIYQAANWTCVGRGSSTKQWVAPNGRTYNTNYPYRLSERDGGNIPAKYYKKKLKQEGWKTQKTNPKIRYLKVLGDDPILQKRVQAKATEYPKRKDIFG